MSLGNRFQSVKMGLHASASDFTTMPTTTVAVPRNFVETLLPRQRTPIQRPTPRIDGARNPAIRGGKDIKAIELPLHFRGANNNDGSAVTDWEAKLEQGAALAALMGTLGTTTSGAATTCSGTASTTLTVASGTNIPTGAVILFTTTTGTFIRRVTGGGGTTTLTLNQAASGTASGTVFRLGVYAMNPATAHHRHVAIDAEQSIDGAGVARTQFLGCMASKGVITLPNNGPLTFDVTLMPTDWSPATPTSTPTHTDPTAGDFISVGGYEFKIGANTFDLRNAKLTIDNAAAMRETGLGPNGVRGGVAAVGDAGKVALLEAEIFLGAGTPGQELQENTGTPSARTLMGASAIVGAIAGTQDLMLAVPNGAGNAFAAFMPAADIDAEIGSSGAFTVVKIKAYGTGTTPLVLAVG